MYGVELPKFVLGLEERVLVASHLKDLIDLLDLPRPMSRIGM